MLKRFLLNRLENHVKEEGGLSQQHYGLQKEKSTVGAIAEVVETIKQGMQGARTTIGYVVDEIFG